MRSKKIALIGGLGKIGRILSKNLSSEYKIIIVDRVRVEESNIPYKFNHQYIQIDISSYKQLIARMPKDSDIVINLAALPEMDKIVDSMAFQKMANVYLIGSYNLFLACRELHIPKVIFASSNKVTGGYERNGISLLNRKITTNDYPCVGNVYGSMKLCAEQFGRIFSEELGLSVICLRIGTVVNNEYEFLKKNKRANRTILSNTDTANIFKAAIESQVNFGIYYAVSDNPDRPWSIENTINELKYIPLVNSETIIKDMGV